MNKQHIQSTMSDIDFLSLSSLFGIYQKQQEPEPRNTTSDEGTISSDDDEDEDQESDENDSTKPHELSTSSSISKDRQLAKFLDSIAEIFSRTKTIPPAQLQRHERRQKSNTKGAGQVSASGFMMANETQQPTVYIAKNEGTDVQDEEMANLLGTWIQKIAFTGCRPAIDKDRVWKKLVEYYKQRLGVYARQIESFPAMNITAVFPEGSNGVSRASARDLHNMSIKYKTNNCTEILRDMVSIAYELRYEETAASLSAQNKQWRTSIRFLGRLRAAYERFKETAIQFSKSFAQLRIVCLPAPDCVLYPKTEVENRIQALAKENNVSQPTPKHIQISLGTAKKIYEVSCHAEIQLLLHLENQSSPNNYPFRYLGCSKKSCWLCHQFLSLYKSKNTNEADFYQTRGSHGRVYPLWHVNLPIQVIDPRIQFNITSTLLNIQGVMRKKLPNIPRRQRPAQAESSANLTVTGTPLKQRALATRKIMEASKPPQKEEPISTLKDFVCSKQCLRIPASGEPPHLLSIDFYNHPDDYPGSESWGWLIPDFGAPCHWHAFNFERFHNRLKVMDNEDRELNGEYALYWCHNDGLEPNQFIMSLLDIGIEELSIGQQFWYGDVFVTRFHEDETTFEFFIQDIPPSVLSYGGYKILANWIRSLWEVDLPEYNVGWLQHSRAKSEKTNADKEIILGRMSKYERQVLKRMPEMLHYLAITACDDGAVLDSSVRKSEDPGMVNISVKYEHTAAEKRGWKGFSADDL